MDAKITNNNFKPICPFCRAKWSDENMRIEELYASGGCESCGSGADISGSIVIACHKCGKVMYKKDFTD
ncbi:MAG: hypothetical protein KKA19_09880 [Candidatus Margulisbacteria bacterium]|nr:hypothetical protein [Candidatus Margulisiibacteriota bacterium]